MSVWRDKVSRQDQDCVLDMERVRALPVDALPPLPKFHGLITSTETDPVTDNDLIVWMEDLVVEGRSVPFGLGVAITREAKNEPDYLKRLPEVRRSLLESVWQMKELVRLGCYRLREPAFNEVTR